MENKIKKYCRIILLFPIKISFMILITIFFPLIWLFDNETSLIDYFFTWKEFIFDEGGEDDE